MTEKQVKRDYTSEKLQDYPFKQVGERFKINIKNKDKTSFYLKVIDTENDTYNAAIINKSLDQLQLIILVIGLINHLIVGMETKQ